VEKIASSHCAGEKAMNIFMAELKENFSRLNPGDSF
jgi:metal-dependent hydrolase (beta-lactamase superfamily II)